MRTTRKLVANKFVWNGLQKQVGTWAKQCIACQSSKVQAHIKAPLEKFSVPHSRFDHIHVDLVGPLPPSNGFTHLLTVIDGFSRWPEAIPLNNTDSSSCAQALVFHWIARFGVPLDLSSDRGPQFTSQLRTSISRLLGTQLHHTTAYHPQSNGLVERFHRHLKSALRARLTGPNWMQELPWVLLEIRTAPKDDLGCSSADMVYGSPLQYLETLFPASLALTHPLTLVYISVSCATKYAHLPQFLHHSMAPHQLLFLAICCRRSLFLFVVTLTALLSNDPMKALSKSSTQARKLSKST